MQAMFPASTGPQGGGVGGVGWVGGGTWGRVGVGARWGGVAGGAA